jgi:outer membrane protein TolC
VHQTINPARSRAQRSRRGQTLVWLVLLLLTVSGCTNFYRRSADKEVYKIVQQKQAAALGQTNEFSIDTRYSARKPGDVKPQEIIEDRTREAKLTLTLQEALRIALENSREYQTRKEQLYLSALTLTAERWEFVPQFFANTTVSGEREPNPLRGKGTAKSVAVSSGVGVSQLLKTGGRVSLDLANDFFRFYSGNGPRDSAASTIMLSLSQPLLRGAGAKIAAENLTQAERDVIYEIRSFSYFQDTFAFDIVETYLRLVQQQDTVINQYSNYLSRVSLRERSVALAVDRLAPFQADLAAQEELSARNTYILAVERYRSTLDQFKVTLGLPSGFDIRLDSGALAELETVGLLPVPLTDEQSFNIALDRRLDLLNEIDEFEDSKRKIVVAADALKPGLLLFGDVALVSKGRSDYATFDVNDHRLGGGARLDLPLNRKLERNGYRRSLIEFERQLRELSLFLDELKNDLREDLRTLDQSRQSYDIQIRAKALADRRVESSELSLQAGRIQVRDVVDAQTARVQAYNAATAALIDYHLARMRLLLDLGLLKTQRERFWLEAGELPKTGEGVTPAPPAVSNELVTPEELFQNEKR